MWLAGPNDAWLPVRIWGSPPPPPSEGAPALYHWTGSAWTPDAVPSRFPHRRYLPGPDLGLITERRLALSLAGTIPAFPFTGTRQAWAGRGRYAVRNGLYSVGKVGDGHLGGGWTSGDQAVSGISMGRLGARSILRWAGILRDRFGGSCSGDWRASSVRPTTGNIHKLWHC